MQVNGKHYRTIWPDAQDPGTIHIIDQRHLPHAFVIEQLRCVDDFVAAISDMHVRGAGLIGVTAAFGMYIVARAAPREGFNARLRQAAARLLATRPTAKNLAWAIDRQLKDLAAAGADHNQEKAIASTFATACRIAEEDAAFCRAIGEHGVSVIEQLSRAKKGAAVNILTHCNAGWLAFVDYGSATAPIYEAQRRGLAVHVWVDETRPWNQGAKLTAWELGQQGVPHTLIADNTGGHLMQHGLVDLVIVGTDRTTRTGDVANKIGTYLKALAARDNNVPFYVALPSSTLDWELRDGLSQIPIEERSGEELKYLSGLDRSGQPATILISPAATPAVNFAFDVTPARLVTGLITERGITAANEKAICALFPEHG